MNWLEEEQQELKTEMPTNFPESLKLKPNVITTITIDFSTKFQVWKDDDGKQVKAIIPVEENGTKKTFWLNKKNPLYAEIIRLGREGQTTFKILQTGEKQDTRYTLIKEA